MARIRSIKPDFFTSETIAQLDMTDRLLFIGLWTHVDDNGVCRDVPALMKAAVFPLDEDVTLMRVAGGLMRLAELGLVVRYMVGGKAYLAVSTWSEHQKVQHPGKPRYPEPDQAQEDCVRVSCESHEVLTPEQGAGSSEQGEEQGAGKPTAFDDFWAVYPRRSDKAAAKKAFDKATKTTNVTDIIEGAQRYADDPNRDPEFTKHAATWLNHGCWEDEPLPPRRGTRSQENAASAAKVVHAVTAIGNPLLGIGAGR